MKINVDIDLETTCGRCDGLGRYRDWDKTCPDCKGEGLVTTLFGDKILEFLAKHLKNGEIVLD